MLNFLLDILPQKPDGSFDGNYYFSDRFGEPAIYALIGFLIVFIGIVLIIAIIWLIGLLMRKTNNLAFLTNIGKTKKKKEDVSSSEAVADSDEVPNEVKAAIIAAIMAYYSEEKPKCEFKVKRIKRL
ncbi:MAG: OadG family protein [Clostridia bacterium]|nr:OadG family protein [Clostridia bacterium]